MLNVDGEPYAFRNVCPVDGRNPLDGGRLTGTVLVCPWHNCAYDARIGQARGRRGRPAVAGRRADRGVRRRHPAGRGERGVSVRFRRRRRRAAPSGSSSPASATSCAATTASGRRSPSCWATCPQGAEVVETGTGGIALLQELMAGCDGLVLIDAVDRGAAPGTVFVLEPEVSPGVHVPDVHLANPDRVLSMAKTMGFLPDRVRIIGCQPRRRRRVVPRSVAGRAARAAVRRPADRGDRRCMAITRSTSCAAR